MVHCLLSRQRRGSRKRFTGERVSKWNTYHAWHARKTRARTTCILLALTDWDVLSSIAAWRLQQIDLWRTTGCTWWLPLSRWIILKLYVWRLSHSPPTFTATIWAMGSCYIASLTGTLWLGLTDPLCCMVGHQPDEGACGAMGLGVWCVGHSDESLSF